ncbi:GumN family protein [Gammaproteobacteria bacterium]|nr:GumN family protein [Gammaproteobacteria bacterium]
MAKKGDVLPLNVENAIRDADQIMLEIDPQDFKEIGQLFGNLICKDACLSKEISPALINDLNNKYSININNMPPSLAYIVLTAQSIINAGFVQETGTEISITKLATKLAKPIVGLEKPAEQISLISNMPLDIIKDELRLLAYEPDTIKLQLETLYKYWKEGDTEGLYEFMHDQERLEMSYLEPDGLEHYQNFLYQLIEGRNKLLFERALGKISQNTNKLVHVIAVGALHLGGDEGLIALFKQEGFKIEKLKTQ